MPAHESNTENPTPLTNDARAAMRAYLQRAEVRLSTMHRIAGVFLNGAGLLFLFPIFLKDAFVQILNVIVVRIMMNDEMYWLALFMLAISLFLPLYAFYLLIEDIVRFYFTAYHAGVVENFFHPRFVLSTITFSEDESQEAKQQIIADEHTAQARRFIVPEDQDQRNYYKQILRDTNREIIPDTRQKVLHVGAVDNRDREDIDLFYTAFGLTGAMDRTLAQEVAKMEMSLVRHALNLRHLVLRYAKALLLFVLTTLLLIVFVDLVNLPIILNSGNPQGSTWILAVGFYLWAVLTPVAVTRPIYWIYRAAEKRLSVIRSDRQLLTFEKVVIVCSIVVMACSLVMMQGFGISWLMPIWNYVVVTLTAIYGFYWYWKKFRYQSAAVVSADPTDDKPEVKLKSQQSTAEQNAVIYDYDLVSLANEINRVYSESELKQLCQRFANYEEIGGAVKSERSSEFVQYLWRRERLEELVSFLKQDRPKVSWDRFRKAV